MSSRRRSASTDLSFQLIEGLLSHADEMRSTINILEDSTTEGINDGHFIV